MLVPQGMPPWAPTTVLPASTLGREGGQSARGPAVCTQLYHEKLHADFLVFVNKEGSASPARLA